MTVEQQKAVDLRSEQIIVAAAAGSGKTRVLVERILKMVLDKAEKINIENLLVATFTELAAAEMKERIEKSLLDKLDGATERAEKEHLLRQIAYMPLASISTIHSFCLSVVRDYFYVVNLDPAFRIGDAAELNMLKSQVMETLFEKSFEENENFDRLIRIFGSGKTGQAAATKDVRLDELVRRLANFLESRPFPDQAATEYLAFFREDIDESEWLRIIKGELNEVLISAKERLMFLAKICKEEDGPEKYLENLDRDLTMIDSLLEVLQNDDFDETHRIFSAVSFGKMFVYSAKMKESEGIDEELRKKVIDGRNGVKKWISGIVEKLFSASPEKIRADIQALEPVIKALLDLTAEFRASFMEEKRKRNLVDFNDLEYYAVQILIKDGEPSEIAKNLSEKYREVLIDEYQDTNEKQELILASIASGACRRFMVGDIKQSIYGFRHARPHLFMEKIREADHIFLSKNFRSRSEILDGVNFFFEKIMPNYDEANKLHYGASYAGVGFVPELHILEATEISDEEVESDFLAVEEDDKQTRAARLEARLIAEKIEELDYPYRDIVVLLRSKKMAAVVTEELKSLNIGAVAEIEGSFFETPEIMLTLSLLRIIDNPRQDIDLIAIMRLYGFTADELLEIRRCSEGDFYDCVLFSKNEKLPSFLADLERWRKKAIVSPISQLLGILYEEADLLNRFAKAPAGKVRVANLQLLLEKAAQYEETSFSGLFNFMQFLEWVKVHSDDDNAAQLPETENLVRVMTIHKSKGLEFPVVFVSQLGKGFNFSDERAKVILHPALGIGAKYVDLEMRMASNTISRQALAILRKQENVEEELRILYVAMTRAKERLILTGCVKDLTKSMEKWEDTPTTPYTIKAAKTVLDWLVPCCLTGSPKGRVTLTQHKSENLKFAAKREMPDENFLVNYPWERVEKPDLRLMPSKLAISELKRIHNLEMETDSTSAFDDVTFAAPEFFAAKEESRILRLGTIMHTIVEHMDFARDRDLPQILALVTDLAARNLIEPGYIEERNIISLLNFVNSPLAAQMRTAKRIFREVPFVIGLSPSEIYSKGGADDLILVHGIIDCYFETPEGDLILVDFKSASNPQVLEERYAMQMKIYEKVLRRIEGREVTEQVFYSF
ncbi:MAG: helicase-exonuclease AddAB subunit AddA [Turicibacter sp.]|nr:helicase-exonuclease AddAB subunit AddA [Turicibacter sp.]